MFVNMIQASPWFASDDIRPVKPTDNGGEGDAVADVLLRKFPTNATWAMKKTWLVGLYRGWNPTQVYRGYNKPLHYKNH